MTKDKTVVMVIIQKTRVQPVWRAPNADDYPEGLTTHLHQLPSTCTENVQAGSTASRSWLQG